MPMPGSPSGLTRDKRFFITSADLFIQVQRRLFRVHSYFLTRDSEYFRRIVPITGPDRAGTSEGDPLILDDVDPESFQAFLWVFYNERRTLSIYDAPLKAWKRILELAHQWDFAKVRELATRELDKKSMDPVERISLYQDNGVHVKYLVSALEELTNRDASISDEEGVRIGLKTALKIARAREQSRSAKPPAPSPVRVTSSGLKDIVIGVFGLEPISATG
ncbi:hypothetical protein FA95DRAFT_518802 [Auriscalpium vulgare]|uniref:Uncharacterized protein n=1 Tax=Auriscalpium vulgare TaxID=40419 RepID=A0ACB8S3X0_9AGAM|nr:hypothetical protein FA95DRAFT_518802 [Auriscalpium vulgare]